MISVAIFLTFVLAPPHIARHCEVDPQCEVDPKCEVFAMVWHTRTPKVVEQPSLIKMGKLQAASGSTGRSAIACRYDMQKELRKLGDCKTPYGTLVQLLEVSLAAGRSLDLLSIFRVLKKLFLG